MGSQDVTVDAGGLLSPNSKLIGSLTARSITGTAGTVLAPLLGDVTGDAGMTGGTGKLLRGSEAWRTITGKTGSRVHVLGVVRARQRT